MNSSIEFFSNKIDIFELTFNLTSCTFNSDETLANSVFKPV